MIQGVDSGPHSRQQVRDVLDDVFKAPEFDQSPGLVEEFFDWLGDLFDFGGIGEGVFDLTTFTMQAVVFVVGVVVVWLGVKYVMQALGGRESAKPVTPGAKELTRNRVAELRAAASAAEEAGDHLLALRLYFFALVVGLGERGELAYNDAWTNRELMERGTPTTQIVETLQPLLGELDQMSFGERQVEASDVSRFELLCDRWLGSLTR